MEGLTPGISRRKCAWGGSKIRACGRLMRGARRGSRRREKSAGTALRAELRAVSRTRGAAAHLVADLAGRDPAPRPRRAPGRGRLEIGPKSAAQAWALFVEAFGRYCDPLAFKFRRLRNDSTKACLIEIAPRGGLKARAAGRWNNPTDQRINHHHSVQ